MENNQKYNEISVQDLGRIEYGKAWDYQEFLMKKGLEIKSQKFKNPDIELPNIEHHLLLCEHPHVYTLGKSGVIENLLIDTENRKKLGVTFYKTNRGGDITYHGPGQLVAYPILDLEQFETDLNKYMRNLEEVVIKTIAVFGIKGSRSSGATGVWLDPEDPSKARKICAMGVKSSRWITLHGLALNVNTEMQFFNNIVPCGIVDRTVTSMEQELHKKVDFEKVKKVFNQCFAEVFNSKLITQEAILPELVEEHHSE